MIKRILILLSCLFTHTAYSAQAVNVEYIHNRIRQKWQITVPKNPTLINSQVIANMKYLLTAIDVANQILNGEKTSNYGEGEFATMAAADTIATDQAINTLIKKIEKPETEYSLTLTHWYQKYGYGAAGGYKRPKDYLLMISAAGTYYIDWGDGQTETIKKTTTNEEFISHAYASNGTYTIRIGGRATKYNNSTTSTVYLSGDSGCMEDGIMYDDYCLLNLKQVEGCLGCIFPTLDDGSQPHFGYTFENADIETVPSDLFNNVYGIAGPQMFKGTFYYSKIQTIPDNLFSGLDTDAPLAEKTFFNTFAGCSNLTGSSARLYGRHLYEIWPNATKDQVDNMYYRATGLSDYTNIPTVWK